MVVAARQSLPGGQGGGNGRSDAGSRGRDAGSNGLVIDEAPAASVNDSISNDLAMLVTAWRWQ